MKATKRETIARYVLSLICFTAYISCFIVVMASAINTSAHDFTQV